MERGGGAYIVEINVDAAVVVQDKVANGIGALDGVGVGVEGLEEPQVSSMGQQWKSHLLAANVLLGDEVARLFVGPQLQAVSASCPDNTARV